MHNDHQGEEEKVAEKDMKLKIIRKKKMKKKNESSNGKNSFEKKLMKFKDLPDYMKDNEYILDYYRCEWPLKDVFFSLFSWHNETLNIWTYVTFLLYKLFILYNFFIYTSDHLKADGGLPDENRQAFAGVFDICRVNSDELHGEDGDRSFDLFQVRAREVSGSLTGPMMKKGERLNVSDQNQMMIPGSHMRHISEEPGWQVPGGEMFQAIPKWPWFIFLSGAMGCFVCSSLSHLLACHSLCFNFFFWRLDYAGISLMIVCSFFAPIYYSFYCNPYARLVYLTSITVLGILAVITLLAPVLSSPRFRSFRAALFVTMGFSGVIPATHAVLLHWGHPHIYMALGFELAMALLYSAGASFYVSRIPEKWKPGAFDVAGHSHQIFHVFVVLGALAHSAAIIFILDFRRGSPVCV